MSAPGIYFRSRHHRVIAISANQIASSRSVKGMESIKSQSFLIASSFHALAFRSVTGAASLEAVALVVVWASHFFPSFTHLFPKQMYCIHRQKKFGSLPSSGL